MNEYKIIITIFIILTLILLMIFTLKKLMLPFLFIHVPKTGGNAIKNTQLFKDSIYFYHASIRNVMEWGKKYRASYAIVRNPYDRLVSAFFYLQDGGEKNKWDINSMKKQQKYRNNFIEFVKNLSEFMDDIHYKPQYTFLTDKNNELKVDHILKQESLNNDYMKLQQLYGYSPVPLNKVNTSKHEDYTHYYDDETRRIVQEVYRKDFELLNYKM